jgi:23S rRNA pseudouridine1911/1915/1917 synthase
VPESRFTIEPDAAGARLDVFLAARTGVTRSQVGRHVDDGVVRVNGEAVKASRKLRAGDQVTFAPPPPAPDEALPEAITLTVLFEDAHLIVVDKPAGLVVHPAAGHATGTLVNALLHHCGALSSVGGRQRPGIVHRLDKDTSGVMIASKTDLAHLSLARQFHDHSIERRYLALTSGAPPQAEGALDTLHGRHPVDRKRFTTHVTRGRRAVTRYRVLERLGGACLVECTLETGRTHQVRVHLSEHGCPLLGDPVYGRTPRDPALRAVATALGRPGLHAAVLGIDHPVTGERLRFTTDPPADFQVALAALRGLPG